MLKLLYLRIIGLRDYQQVSCFLHSCFRTTREKDLTKIFPQACGCYSLVMLVGDGASIWNHAAVIWPMQFLHGVGAVSKYCGYMEGMSLVRCSVKALSTLNWCGSTRLAPPLRYILRLQCLPLHQGVRAGVWRGVCLQYVPFFTFGNSSVTQM